MSSNETPAAINELDAQPHSQADIDLITRLYLEKRIQGQLDFYHSRGLENELNSDFTFTAGTFIMTLSSLLATFSVSAAIPVLALISAILPAFSALLAAFRQLYGWDRQSAIYRDAMLGLQKIRLIAPDDDRMDYADLQPILPRLVMSSEAVFTAEVSQWGQIFTAAQEQEAQDQASDPLTRLISSAKLSEQQQAAIQSIVSAGRSEGREVAADVTSVTDVRLYTQPAGDDAPELAGEFTAASRAILSTEFIGDQAAASEEAGALDEPAFLAQDIPPQETFADSSAPAEDSAFGGTPFDDGAPLQETPDAPDAASDAAPDEPETAADDPRIVGHG